MLNRLPWLLVLFRIASGPAMIALAFAGHGVACALLLSLGVLSDIFDGIIARRLGVATPALRTWDSRADVAFWLCAVIAVAVLRPGLVPALWPAAAVIAVLEIGNHAFSFAKFRREASPHHYLSKAFGLGLWLLFGLAFATGSPGVVLWCVLALGVASQLEAFAITLRLKAWRCDVPSVITLR
ncbi:MAG: CDP-diacylglycerol--glycerol-3-phosphate 3-phosphatidyltransferase [bacterium]|nr:MAG: CDP-diacylglycerol--glycerol-3-phosphate 3-phosphatidyltransferase [bacterium]